METWIIIAMKKEKINNNEALHSTIQQSFGSKALTDSICLLFFLNHGFQSPKRTKTLIKNNGKVNNCYKIEWAIHLNVYAN